MSKKVIMVTGGYGMLGSAVSKVLETNPDNIIVKFRSREVDLTNQKHTEWFVKQYQPDEIYHCAGLVGGITANMNGQYEFLSKNAAMAMNIVGAARKEGIPKLNFMSSSCAYPADCPQPMKEEMMLTGSPEPTNRGYMIAKTLGTELCRFARQDGMDYKSMVPCNLYGPGDNFYPTGHVLASLVRKFCYHQIKVESGDPLNRGVTVWGDGTPRREFLHVYDAAEAIVRAANEIDEPVINIGSGEDISISELAETIADIMHVSYNSINYDYSKPNGMLRKCMDISKLKSIGWLPRITLEDGIRELIDDYKRIEGGHNVERNNS